MSLNTTTLFIILGCAFVTFIPRVLPFVIVRNFTFPPILMKWLSFIPVCIFTALIMSELLGSEKGVIGVDALVLFAMIPTFIVALWKKNLSLTIMIGVISMAVLRFVFY